MVLHASKVRNKSSYLLTTILGRERNSPQTSAINAAQNQSPNAKIRAKTIRACRSMPSEQIKTQEKFKPFAMYIQLYMYVHNPNAKIICIYIFFDKVPGTPLKYFFKQ